MDKILLVNCDDLYRMRVTFENQFQLTIDFSKRKENIRFAPLRDISFFKSATTDGQFVRWADKIEISVREIWTMIDEN